jgi:hypothetical protein
MDPMKTLLPDGTETVCIHYAYRHEAANRKVEYRVACAPQMRDLASGPNRPMPMHRTNDPRAGVSCPACLQTEVYKRDLELAQALARR